MNAKYTFWYVLSLVALAIGSISLGAVVFQLINKYITTVGELYASRYSLESLRFGLAALFIAGPVYLWSTRAINRGLESDELESNAGVRRWLTYFIMLVASLVLIGYAIGVIYSFLQGELTVKFLLKAITVAALAGGILSYYTYDLRHSSRGTEVRRILNRWRWGTIVLIVAVLITGFALAESPTVTRERRQDAEVVNQLSQLDNLVARYYELNGALPKDLAELKNKTDYVTQETLVNPITGELFGYEVLPEGKYKLCSSFQRESDEEDNYYYSVADNWKHGKGEQCFTRTVNMESALKPIVR